MPSTQTADSLRWIGEAADGIRDTPCAIVWNSEDKLEVVDALKVGSQATLGVTVLTPSNGSGMHHDKPVEIVYDGKNILLDPKIDAIFLTQSAVEKFVLPYYTRMQTLEWTIAKRDELFKDPNVVAAVHASPSITSTWPGGQGGGQGLLAMFRDPATGDISIL